jgi:hypothetical protein
VRSKFTLRERLQETPEPHSRNPIISPGLIEKLPKSYKNQIGKDRGQKTEVRDQRSEVRGRTREGRRHPGEIRYAVTDVNFTG